MTSSNICNIGNSVLLVIQLFIMESEESRKLKESSTVPEAGYVFLLCVVIGNVVFSLENLLNKLRTSTISTKLQVLFVILVPYVATLGNLCDC